MLGHRKLSPEDYFRILKKRAWIVIVPAVVFAAVGVGLTFFVPPRYESQTLVLIEQQKVPENFVRPVVTEDLNSRLASMQEQILSRSRLQPIIERFNLYGNKGMGMDARIDMVRKDISIKPIESQIARTGGLPGFFISFRAEDPHTAQQACGEVTSLFTSENLRERQASAEGTTDFLKGQLADAKQNLDEQDAKQAAFQRANAGRLPDETGANMSMVSALNSQLDAVTQQLSQLEQNKTYGETMLATQQRDLPTGDQQRVQPQVQQAELQQLQSQETELTTRYTDDYPDVVAVRRKIKELREKMAKAPAVSPTPAPPTPAPASTASTKYDPANIVAMKAQLHAMDQTIAQKRQAQASLQAQLRQYQDRISSSPTVQEEFKQITRDYQQALAFYNDLLQKMSASKMATDLERRQQGEQFKVMDEPNLPDGPSFPKRSVFLSGGLGAGVFLGLLIVAWIEYRDTAVRTEQDIWAFTKLPTLAVISLAADVTQRETKRKSLFGGRKDKIAAANKPLMNAGG
jgi:polysaccharide chain length determinant protein (PEP-CTERM system associated)